MRLSYNNADIEHALKKVGCEIRSQLRAEEGKLTQWEIGKRRVYITPSVPLATSLFFF